MKLSQNLIERLRQTITRNNNIFNGIYEDLDPDDDFTDIIYVALSHTQSLLEEIEEEIIECY